MDTQIRAIINKCLNMSSEELYGFAKENYDKVYAHLVERTSENDANGILVGTIFVSVAADSGFSDAEYDFISRIIGGYTHGNAKELAMKFSGSRYQSGVKSIINVFPYDIRLAFLSLCIAVLSVDKSVDRKEVDFINRLLAEDWR